MLRIGKSLSRELHVSVFGFLIHDSDIFCYWLFEDGEICDEYNSCPDYFQGMDEEEDAHEQAQYRERVRGQAEVVLRHCVPGTQIADVEAVIHPPEPQETDPAQVALPQGYPSAKALDIFSQLLKVPPQAIQQQIHLHVRQKYRFAEEQLSDFGRLLGIDDERVGTSYRDVTDGEVEFEFIQVSPKSVS